MFWAAMAFACGLFAGQFMWRPPLWWLIAAAVVGLAAFYYLRRRVYCAIALAWTVIFVMGALTIQLHAG